MILTLIQINRFDLLRRFRGSEPLQYELGPLEPVKVQQAPDYEERDRSEENDERGPAPIVIISIVEDGSIEERDPQLGDRQEYKKDR